MEKVIVGRSLGKTFLLILGAMGFVALGVWTIAGNGFDLFEKIVGGIGILFFGAAIPIGVKKLINNENALELNHGNLIIEPDSNKRLVIPWEKIVGFGEVRIEGVKFITINVSKPEEWMNREQNAVKKKLMQFNNLKYQTPFNIGSGGLNISHKKLLGLLIEFHRKSKLN